jgi:hypothetical protein
MIKFTTINVDGLEVIRQFKTIRELKNEYYSDNCDLPANDDKIIFAEINGEQLQGVKTFKELMDILDSSSFTKSKLLKIYREHPYTKFAEHNELIALIVCAESFYGDDERKEFDELLFAVEKDWLINYLNTYRDWIKWDFEEVQRWVQNEYASDDSHEIFCDALLENAIVMLQFN